MPEGLIDQVQQAIERSLQWAHKGWKVTFGERGVEVSSLPQARSLPESFICSEEAVDYWTHVAQTGREAAGYGKKALAALRRNDFKMAEDALYFSRYLESPFANFSATWKPVHAAVASQAQARPVTVGRMKPTG